MKHRILFFASILMMLFIGLYITNKEPDYNEKRIADLRKTHERFLRNSPFKTSLKLTKEERKARRLPPNKYFEREWELTLDPSTGKPEPKRVFELQKQLKERAMLAKVPGENTNNWEERGPDNVGGRTRAIMFDPNDPNGKKVFAGGVSGGLWVNNDITDANSAWTEVAIPNNLSITCITYDPNNTTTFYVGTGESYVQGDVQGNGVWQSTNGGTTWSKVFGGVTGETTFESSARLTVNSPGSIAGEYMLAPASFGPALTSVTRDLVLVDDGSGAPSEGCNALTNGVSINNKIAVIERGSCNFTVKVKNAQDAGAVAVLMVNNVAGAPIVQGGEDATITIPSAMISKEEGQAIIAQLGSGVNVTMASVSSPVTASYVTPGIHHINDIKIRDNGGTSEVYVAAGSTFYPDANPISLFGVEDYGLYRSINSGTSWSKITLPLAPGGSGYEPNDIEVSFDNTMVWVSTTSNIYSAGGGAILSSSNGTSFTLKKTLTDGLRTQIAMSSVDADKLYVLAEINSDVNPVGILMTDDGFATETSLTLPVDVETDIPAEDFTNGQAFYNLLIEVDPTNDNILYVGGIDLFRSSDAGSSWSQISEYYSSTGLNDVHPDQHAFVFDPSDPTKAVNGNDGGVYYATALSGTPSITARNKNYNTIQFYHGAIGQEVGSEKLLAGSQDNGSLLINNASPGIGSSGEVTGGDGTYVFIDEDNQYMVTSSQYGNYYYRDYATGTTSGYTIENGSPGQFVNPAALDSDSNYLFADGSDIVGGVYQINRYELKTNTALADDITDAMFDGAATAFKVSPYSANTLFVGTDNGKLFKITNATSKPSVSWQEITGDAFYGSISCVELGANDNEIFVTFHNYGIASVYYSLNGGSTWLNKEGDLPDLPVKAILMNPLNSDEVILGTELGVWATPNFNDVSPNWYQAQNGMKDAKVTSFNLRTVDNTVLATTYGRGMFTGKFTADASTLSVDKKVADNLIRIYPTVSNGSFNVSVKQGVNGQLAVYDLNGRVIHGVKVNFAKNPVETISIKVASGLYLVKFLSDGLVSTHKIIIE
ncbi:PA domain-containing protein [Snuella sedimenti]|uniref:T9SS type A sorting domain-containing protein n=1 Tax=Snuella sedimenti TaxID=2798802 RepID=A0A8J7IRV8_9FLAO|nr:PA domain-containing protein [Snuella sedimenti]MBJ6366725.1 T9SS type A sorting domain-containing protein [Snuella sedimenti]